jgi:hypothetical protein
MTPEQILTIHERLDEVMGHISIHDMTGDWDVASGNNMYDALEHLRDALPQRPETGWMVRSNGVVIGVYDCQANASHAADYFTHTTGKDADVLPCIDTGEWEERREHRAKPNTPSAEDDNVVWGHA